MLKDEEVSVSLTIDNWMLIMRIIEKYSHALEGDWIPWADGVSHLIQLSIDKFLVESNHVKVFRFAVHERHLNSIGYDSSSQVLDIQYDSGDLYRYYEVPFTVFSDLVNSEEKWNYYCSNICNRFIFTKMGSEPLLHYKGRSHRYRTYD
jgi:hypothetical protein